jgi:carboxynorspermidine decarboxylase
MKLETPSQYENLPSPCWILDEALLRKNLSWIQSIRERTDAQMILALKGFAMWRVFDVLREYGFDTCAASGANEARLAFEEMGSPAHTYSPMFRDADFSEVLRCSSHITFNSVAQYERFKDRLTPGVHSPALRLNPGFSEVETELYNPCAPGSRMGISAEVLDVLPAGIEGLHVHALCESDASDLVKMLAAFEALYGHWLGQVKWLNLGGGHLMTREGYDVDLLVETLRGLQERYPHLQVILEPSSAYAWQTGVLLATVEDVITSGGIQTAMLDISFTAHMPDCLEMPYQPRVRGSVEAFPGKPKYRLGGSTCLSGDWMGDWFFEQELQVGQRILFEDMIHYTMVKTTTFNGVPHPAIAVDRGDRE